jgi:hypothetical protein
MSTLLSSAGEHRLECPEVAAPDAQSVLVHLGLFLYIVLIGNLYTTGSVFCLTFINCWN